MARDTKLGQEEITRDIPNVGEEALKNLDEAGIVYIGAEVKPGDILVGKVTPKGESPMTPEEKLLRAIFGEKASDVRDTSLRAAAGRLRHDRRGAGVLAPRRRQGRARAGDRARGDRAPGQGPRRREGDPRAQLRSAAAASCCSARSRSAACKGIKPGTKLTDEVLDEYTPGQWRADHGARTTSVMADIEALKKQFDETRSSALEQRFENKVEKLQRGDELPPGVMKMVKVFVAVKRKLQPGDKMAGRHGNKGVISSIMPIEDMPYLEDGTPVDIVLNPLGVPSRMNVGQILETHLGWAVGRRSAARSARCWTRCSQGGKVARAAQAARRRSTARTAQGPTVEDLTDDERDRAGGQSARTACRWRRRCSTARARTTSSACWSRRGSTRRARCTLVDGRTGERVRPQGDGRLHLHAEAAPPGGRQDPRALDRPVQPRHPAAAGRQGAVRRPALRRDGGVGARGLRRGLHACRRC